MEFIIRGDKMKVTDSMKNYIEEKIGKLEKYLGNNDNIRVNVVIKVRGIDQIVEITIPLKSVILRSEEKQTDFYKAVDKTIDKLERQIRKNKTKLSKQSKINIKFDNDNNEEFDQEEEIVKRKKITVKPMNEEEAILQMELLNHDFFVFKNIDEECVSVMYKRRDGDYGIINVK